MLAYLVSTNDKLIFWWLVLHPYYKLAYIQQNWGGIEEQDVERAAGNQHAINWQDEAEKVLEEAVCHHSLCHKTGSNTLTFTNRWPNTGEAAYEL